MRGRRLRPGPIRCLAMISAVLLLPGCGGGPAKLDIQSDEPGNFRVLAAGKPSTSKQTLKAPAGPLELTATSSVDHNGVRRMVAYADLPSASASGDPSSLLDGGVGGMGGDGRWTVREQGPASIDGHPGRDVRFTVKATAGGEEGSGRARIYLVGNRLYQAIMVGPASKVTDEELDHFVKSFELLKKVPTVATAAATAPSPAVAAARAGASAPEVAEPATPPAGPSIAARTEPEPEPSPDRAPSPSPAPRQAPPRGPMRRAPRPSPRGPDRNEPRLVQTTDEGPNISRPAAVAIEAGAGGGSVTAIPDPGNNPRDPFRQPAPPRGVLVGFRAGYVQIMGGPKIAAVQPIYQVGIRYVRGKQIGARVPLETTVVAKSGYAVGAVRTRTGLTVDAFQVIFMRFRDGQLDPDDSYSTNWLGDPRGGGPRDASGDGKLIVGVHGRSDGRAINTLGLLVAE